MENRCESVFFSINMENCVYDNLLEQYKKLSKEEMRALLIYKSYLYKLINLVTSIENFL